MAIRVRKLARELERTPAEIVGLLHVLGHERYKSADDQIPDTLIPLLKTAIKKGVKPAVVQIDERPSAAPVADRGPDLMARLVPGVVRHGERPVPVSAAPLPVSRVPEPRPAVRAEPELAIGQLAHHDERRAFEAERRALEAERNAMLAERAAFDAERSTIAHERAILDSERRMLVSDRLMLASERTEIAEDRARIAQDRAQIALARDVALGASLMALLEGRGLRGPEEQERAIGSLAASKQLRLILPSLRTTDPDGVERVLADRVILAATPTQMPGAAVVVVGAERAELPERDGVERELRAISEQLMLLGLRRLAIVGGPPRWHKLIREGLDPRIEIRFQAGGLRTRAEAESDVTRTDVVVLWATAADPAAREVYATSRAIVAEIPAPEVASLLRGLRQRLDAV